MMNKLMMMLLCSLFIINCKEKKVEATSPLEEKFAKETAGGIEIKEVTPDVATMVAQAEAILKYRHENSPKTWPIIDVGVWQFEGYFKDGKMLSLEEIAGKWIDFDDKWNYEYADSKGNKGSGRYHYSNDTNLLLLVDNNKSIKPVEYEVKLVNNIMIVMGKDTYKDNNQQGKLVKLEKRPF